MSARKKNGKKEEREGNVLGEDYIPSLQECLIDSAILKNVHDFFTGRIPPSISAILDIFSLAEALVLFDDLVSPDEWRVPGGLEKVDVSFLGKLSDVVSAKEDMVSFSVYYGIPNDDAFDYAMNFCFSLDKRFSDQWRELGASPVGKDFSLEISDTLNIFHRAWKWKCNLVAHPLWEMFFISEDKPMSVQPKGLYDKISVSLRKEIEMLQNMKYPLPLYIPPIPAIALREINGDLTRFWSVVGEIRKEFLSCRRKYSDYQNVIANPDSRSLGELVQQRRDTISDVENELDRLAKKRTDGRVLMEFWDSIAKFEVKGGTEGEIEFSTGANLAKLLGKSLGWVRSWIIRGRARSLFDIHRKALSIKSYDRLLNENLGLSREDLEIQAKSLADYSMDVRKATGNLQ